MAKFSVNDRVSYTILKSGTSTGVITEVEKCNGVQRYTIEADCEFPITRKVSQHVPEKNIAILR